MGAAGLNLREMGSGERFVMMAGPRLTLPLLVEVSLSLPHSTHALPPRAQGGTGKDGRDLAVEGYHQLARLARDA